MKPGDIVTCAETVRIGSVIDPTFSHRGRSRTWHRGQIGLIVDVGYIEVGNTSMKKFQVMIEGELWWVTRRCFVPLEEQDVKDDAQ